MWAHTLCRRFDTAFPYELLRSFIWFSATLDSTEYRMTFSKREYRRLPLYTVLLHFHSRLILTAYLFKTNLVPFTSLSSTGSFKIYSAANFYVHSLPLLPSQAHAASSASLTKQ